MKVKKYIINNIIQEEINKYLEEGRLSRMVAPLAIGAATALGGGGAQAAPNEKPAITQVQQDTQDVNKSKLDGTKFKQVFNLMKGGNLKARTHWDKYGPFGRQMLAVLSKAKGKLSIEDALKQLDLNKIKKISQSNVGSIGQNARTLMTDLGIDIRSH